jgi:hypothetical protein
MIELLPRSSVAEGMTSFIPVAVSRFAPLRCSDRGELVHSLCCAEDRPSDPG